MLVAATGATRFNQFSSLTSTAKRSIATTVVGATLTAAAMPASTPRAPPTVFGAVGIADVASCQPATKTRPPTIAANSKVVCLRSAPSVTSRLSSSSFASPLQSNCYSTQHQQQ
eukprot:GHVS01002990.1.p1 GENE.GHVS01002990.1~~GHVS01002990.1.p1  ORF type:complete len:114 (+),score=30.59 GHVS01002990.1:329-670(+)